MIDLDGVLISAIYLQLVQSLRFLVLLEKNAVSFPLTLLFQLEFYTIFSRIFVFGGFWFEFPRVHFYRDETESVGEKFVLEYTIVLVNYNFFYCDSRNISNHDSSQGVCDSVVHVEYIHLKLVWVVFYYIDGEVLHE